MVEPVQLSTVSHFGSTVIHLTVGERFDRVESRLETLSFGLSSGPAFTTLLHIYKLGKLISGHTQDT